MKVITLQYNTCPDEITHGEWTLGPHLAYDLNCWSSERCHDGKRFPKNEKMVSLTGQEFYQQVVCVKREIKYASNKYI
jgi:hypothetical protein